MLTFQPIRDTQTNLGLWVVAIQQFDRLIVVSSLLKSGFTGRTYIEFLIALESMPFTDSIDSPKVHI